MTTSEKDHCSEAQPRVGRRKLVGPLRVLLAALVAGAVALAIGCPGPSEKKSEKKWRVEPAKKKPAKTQKKPKKPKKPKHATHPHAHGSHPHGKDPHHHHPHPHPHLDGPNGHHHPY